MFKKLKKILGISLLSFPATWGGSWYFTPLIWMVQSQPLANFYGDRQIINTHSDRSSNSSLVDRLAESGSSNKSRQDSIEMAEVAGFRLVMQEAIAQNLYQRPMGEIMQAIAEHFIGTPYQEGLLDQSQEEKLVISLKGFDCVLFVETVLAIARGVAMQDYTYQTFANRIQDQRYYEGKINGYCSRMHYFSEWIDRNQTGKNVENITIKLGGILLDKKLNFMTHHRNSYPQLVNNANYQCIGEMEDRLAKVPINYIPQSQIESIYSQLQPGDIVAVATAVKGLDVTHTGLVYRFSDGRIGLIHASPSGAVKIAPDLQSYISRVEDAIGIIVARPSDPRQRS